MGTTAQGRWAWSTYCLVVARQNGKSEVLVPRIRRALKVGEKVLHTAQNRSLPREIFERVADLTPKSELKRPVRSANGQERIDTWSGGVYRIVAPTREGARGPSNDLVLIDEAREMLDLSFIAAARPTLTASRNPQTVYLSNAGDALSVVLNGLRTRAVELGDLTLCFLEWSIPDGADIDDQAGWAMANPSLGRHISWETLEQFRLDYAATPSIFLTEHLCRSVDSMRPGLVNAVTWQRAESKLDDALRPSLGISQARERIAAAIAWRQADGTIALRPAADVTGDPVDVDQVGRELVALARRLGVTTVGYSPETDRDLARHFDVRGIELTSISGQTSQAAAGRFVATLDAGQLRWADAQGIGVDLAATVRDGTPQAFHARPAKAERPVPAALAAIHAVWLATQPRDDVPTVH